MGKRKIAEKVELYLKIVKTMALVLALFGGGFAGAVKYREFIENVVGETIFPLVTAMIVGVIAILSAIIISVIVVVVRLNSKDRE
jgi:hypothetical protein